MGILSFGKSLLRRNHNYVSGDSIKWFGTDYGGFYVDVSLIKPSSTLFSFGVGEDMSFDLAVHNLGVKNIHLFDPTPKAIAFVKSQNLPAAFSFHPFGLSDQNEKATFFLPRNDNHVSGSLLVHKNLDAGKAIEVELKKLSSVMTELQTSHIDVLKIDIEGSEYKVIQNMLREGVHPTQLCVEFHNDFFDNGKQLFADTLHVLKAGGYKTEGISRSGKEMLFVRRQ